MTKKTWPPQLTAGIKLCVMSMPLVKPSTTIITPANVTLDILEMVLFVTVCENCCSKVLVLYICGLNCSINLSTPTSLINSCYCCYQQFWHIDRANGSFSHYIDPYIPSPCRLKTKEAMPIGSTVNKAIAYSSCSVLINRIPPSIIEHDRWIVMLM